VTDRLRRGGVPFVLGSAVVLAGFAPLLSPSVALGSRDVPRFHLPLRSAFAQLVHEGVPTWNPWIHGGQPILSNPNYAAFYPPTWLGLLVGPTYGLNLLVLLHAALAFAGAWVLARRLGCEPPAAALAAVSFAGGGAFVSLVAAFNLFCGLAWIPWVLVAVERVLRTDENVTWLPAALGGGAALAAILLAGDPTAVLVAGLGVVALGTSELRRPRRVVRLAVPLAVAVALSAVQWLPTWQRLDESPRSGPLPLAAATEWSTPPVRLAEVVFPHLWGDPARAEEGLYFAWHLHDGNYPYVVSLYSGLLIAVLALSALVRWPVPRRSAWVVALSVGVFLALGRHNPLYPWLHQHLPLLGRTRFPEKFLLLATTALPFLAASGWQRLLEERRRGRTRGVDVALALAAAVLVVASALAILVHTRPAGVEAFMKAGSPLPLSEQTLERGRAYLATEAWAAVATAAGVVLILVLYRWRRVAGPAVASLAVLVLAGDLWYQGHRLVHTVPAELYRQPPALAARLQEGRGRIFRLPEDDSRKAAIVFRRDRPRRRHVEHGLARIDPLSGLLWRLAYAFSPDYDLMHTARATRNREILDRDWDDRDLALRLLGAWNVGHLVAPRSDRERLEALVEGRRLAPAYAVENPYLLHRYRFVPRIELHADEEEALAAARRERYDFIRVEHWIGENGQAESRPPTPRPELLAADERGGEIEVRYRAPRDSYFVAAVTWDTHWTARVESSELPLFPTSIGQIGCIVPAGEHRLRLRYRDPWVPVGMAVSGATVAVLLALWALLRRRRADGGSRDRSVAEEPRPEATNRSRP